MIYRKSSFRMLIKKDIYRVYGDLLNTYGYSLKGGESSFTTEKFL